MSKMNISFARTFYWLISRFAVIYIILLFFCLTCVDLKTFDNRVKARRLNQAVPKFADMVNFSLGKIAKERVDWVPFKHYFELVLRYLPDDMVAKQLLGYVDLQMGQEEQSIALFKNSTDAKGHLLFWSNYNLGVIYYKKGMWPQAAQYLFNAISSSSQLTLFLMQNSIMYKQIFASTDITYILEDRINSAKSNAYILLLSSLHNLRQYDKMIAVSKLGIEDQDLSYKDDFYYNAGLAFYETGEVQRSFMLFQKSLAMEKNNPDVYFYIANIYQRAGQTQQAQDFFRISYALHQKNDPRFPYEAHVNLRFF